MSTNLLAPTEDRSSALAKVEQSRAVTEVQGAILIAKQFPRDEKRSLDKILNACSRFGLAQQASYAFARGGTQITGPSIRLLEAIAQNWGNIEFGFRELSRTRGDDGVSSSEVEAYAWDVENNVRRPARFTVRHWRDKRGGGSPITEERDIYELVANMAQRRVRACLLALIPGDVVEEAWKQCDVTMRAEIDVTPEGIKKILAGFESIGVAKDQIEKRLQRRIESIQPAQVISLRQIFQSIKDGMSAPSDWFEVVAPSTEVPEFLKPEDKP